MDKHKEFAWFESKFKSLFATTDREAFSAIAEYSTIHCEHVLDANEAYDVNKKIMYFILYAFFSHLVVDIWTDFYCKFLFLVVSIVYAPSFVDICQAEWILSRLKQDNLSHNHPVHIFFLETDYKKFYIGIDSSSNKCYKNKSVKSNNIYRFFHTNLNFKMK